MAAILLRGLALAVDDAERHPRSLTVHYLEAPEEGPVELTATVERTGRGLTTATGRLIQGGRTICIAVGAFGKERGSSVALHDASPPALGGPIERRPADGASPIHDRWDTVIRIGDALASGAPAVTGGMIRLAERRPMDALVAAAAMDAWFRRSSSTTTDAATHYVCRFDTEVAAGGHLVEDGELWSPDGTLLVVSRQLAVVVG